MQKLYQEMFAAQERGDHEFRYTDIDGQEVRVRMIAMDPNRVFSCGRV